MLDMLAELCIAWPKRWDEYVAPACWIKRTLPDPTLPNNMTPFELLFGRKPRISLDTLVPQIDATDVSGGLDSFVESRRQNSGKYGWPWKSAIKIRLTPVLRRTKKYQENRQVLGCKWGI